MAFRNNAHKFSQIPQIRLKKNHHWFYHDFFIGLVFSLNGFQIHYCEVPYTQYRQHDYNETGHLENFLINAFKQFLNPLQYYSTSIHRRKIALQELDKQTESDLTPKLNEFLSAAFEIKIYYLSYVIGAFLFRAVAFKAKLKNWLKRNLPASILKRLQNITESAISQEILFFEELGVAEFSSKPNLSLQNSKTGMPKVVICIPTIDQSSFFAGTRTILELALSILKNSDFQVECLVTNQELINIDSDLFYEFIEDNSQLKNFTLKDMQSFDPGIGGIIIFTAWWTIYKFEMNFGPLDTLNFKTGYFVQDFEPGFYPFGDRYKLAEATYKRNYDYLFILSPNLGLFFTQSNYKMMECKQKYVLPALIFGSDQLPSKKPNKLRILVYWRPKVERNDAYEIFFLLKKMANAGLIDSKDEIVLAGSNWDLFHPIDELNIINIGKLSYENYFRQLSSSTLVISFISSPHNGVVHYEALKTGAYIITSPKDILPVDPKILPYSHQTKLDELAEFIQRCRQDTKYEPVTINWKDECNLDIPFIDFDEIPKLLKF